MPKWCKTLVAILLLPACLGAASALWKVVRSSGSADTIWVATASGATCWLAIYLLLPKPMWVYVFGHELTHALWTWLMGGRVKKFKASSTGGHVIVTKNNFLIALAPYFFPLPLGTALLASCLLTGAALTGFGALKGRYVGAPTARSAIQTLVVGGTAAAIAFLTGRALSQLAA